MKISILQWNIWSHEDINNVVKFLTVNRADIICLQELTQGSPTQNYIDSAKYIATKLKYNFYFSKVSIDGNIGNGIFSRFPIIRSSKAWIQEPTTSTDDYSNRHRLYIEAQLKLPQSHLSVGTTHMSYTHRFVNTAKKQLETRKLLENVKNKKEKFILTGDLNNRPHSYTVKNLQRYLKHAGPAMSQKTWTTKPFSYGDLRRRNLGGDWTMSLRQKTLKY